MSICSFRKLSDDFMPDKVNEPILECKVRMLNINYGHNEKILKAMSLKLHMIGNTNRSCLTNLDYNLEKV